MTLEDPRPDAPAFSTESGFAINPTYYALEHFSKWLDPGFQRVGAAASAGGLRASAYISPEGDRVTAVLLNTDVQAHTVALAIAASSPAARAPFARRATSSALRRSVRWGCRTPSRSVATIVFDGAVGD